MSSLVRTDARAPSALTPEQAQILYNLVQVNGAILEARYSKGIWLGLLDGLRWIVYARGAYIPGLYLPTVREKSAGTKRGEGNCARPGGD